VLDASIANYLLWRKMNIWSGRRRGPTLNSIKKNQHKGEIGILLVLSK
jgi:hypothetical protein